MKKIVSLLFFLFIGWTLQAKDFPKVILAGDYPDPSILRDGKDYYMTHSPFYYAPGFLIWHSQDLEHWEPVCRAMAQWEGSAMAPDWVKYNNRYYIYYPAAGTNWVIWADDIRGPWSTPIDLKVKGIDPGHVADAEGKRYLYLSEGKVVQLSDDGLSTVGEVKKVLSPELANRRHVPGISEAELPQRVLLPHVGRRRNCRTGHQSHGRDGTLEKRTRSVGKLSVQPVGAYLQ